MTNQSQPPVTHHASRVTFHAPRSTLHAPRSPAFTLIELLVVIAIIAILAALVIPISGAVTAARTKARAKAEMAQIETAIERYKLKLGHYPPDNPGKPEMNQLYYELAGTTFDGTRFYKTLDGSVTLDINKLQGAMGPGKVSGIVNSTKGGGGDDVAANASKFLPELKPSQLGSNLDVIVLVSIPWPPNVPPIFPNAKTLNPWRYNSSNPTNNPNSYDLWLDVIIKGKTNRVCNWSKQVLRL